MYEENGMLNWKSIDISYPDKDHIGSRHNMYCTQI